MFKPYTNADIIVPTPNIEFWEPPHDAFNILLETGHAALVTSGYDDEGEPFFNVTTLIPDEGLILHPKALDSLDLSGKHEPGYEPQYTKGTATIENLDLSEVADILNALLQSEHVANPFEIKAIITRNCYVVNVGVRAVPETFPITQYGGNIYDATTGNQLAGNDEKPDGWSNPAIG